MEDNQRVLSGSVPSGLAKNNQQPPQNSDSTIANRSLPDYIDWPSDKSKVGVAYNVWLAGKLSDEPCKTCHHLGIECWVNAGYKRCARCVLNGSPSRDCNATGTMGYGETVM